MAHITVITDDLDGSPDAEEFHFSLQGAEYVLDLGAKSQEKLYKALAPFIDQASTVRAPKAAKRDNSGRGYDLAKLRRWADEHSVGLPQRGRIPRQIVNEYLAAGGK